MSQLSNGPTRTFEKFLDQFLRPFECFFSKWWFRIIFQIFEYFPDFPLKRVRHTQFTFGWEFWLQMLPKNFLWGLETCLKYVTTSPDLRLSNGTKIVAFEALEKIRYQYFQKRRPHLAFESYFSIFNNITLEYWTKSFDFQIRTW